MKGEVNGRVQVKHRFSALPERVFDAWLDPKNAGKWLFATESGRMVRVEIDPRVGGRFVITERRDGEDVEHTGEYLEIDRPRRLVFTFSVPKYSSDVSRVTIVIVPSETGCDLTLTNEDVPADYVSSTEAGWTAIFRALEAALS